MGFGWLKTVGNLALAGVKVAGPALPGGGFITKLLPLVIKGATGLHNVSGVVKYLPSLTPGQYASIEHAILGVGARVLPGFMVGMYFQNPTTSEPGSTSASKRRWKRSRGGCRKNAMHPAAKVAGPLAILAVLGGSIWAGFPDTPGLVVDRIMAEEGFRAKPYPDSRGILTIGFGTNIGEGITRREAEFLLRERLAVTYQTLTSKSCRGCQTAPEASAIGNPRHGLPTGAARGAKIPRHAQRSRSWRLSSGQGCRVGLGLGAGDS